MQEFYRLTPEFAIACFARTARAPRPGSTPLLRALGKRYTPETVCGVLGEHGQWLLAADFEYVELTGTLANGAPVMLLLRGDEPCALRLKKPLRVTCLGQPLTALSSQNRLAFSQESDGDRWSGTGLFGYLASDGQWAIPPRFESAHAFYGKVSSAQQDRRAVLINLAGEVISPFHDFVSTRWLRAKSGAAARHPGTGIINARGDIVVPFLFYGAAITDNGKQAKVCDSNRQCQQIALAAAPRARIASIPALTNAKSAKAADGWQVAAENNRWGYMDGNGKWMIKPRFDAAEAFAEGLAVVQSGEVWGVLQADGTWLFKPGFRSITPFRHGVALADHQEEGCILLHRDGKRIAAGDFQLICDTVVGENGLVAAKNRLGSKSGYLDGDGTWVIAPEFISTSAFRHGYAVVSAILPEAWQPANYKPLPWRLLDAHWLNHKLAVLRLEYQGQERQALIDQDGNWLVPAP